MAYAVSTPKLWTVHEGTETHEPCCSASHSCNKGDAQVDLLVVGREKQKSMVIRAVITEVLSRSLCYSLTHLCYRLTHYATSLSSLYSPATIAYISGHQNYQHTSQNHTSQNLAVRIRTAYLMVYLPDIHTIMNPLVASVYSLVAKLVAWANSRLTPGRLFW